MPSLNIIAEFAAPMTNLVRVLQTAHKQFQDYQKQQKDLTDKAKKVQEQFLQIGDKGKTLASALDPVNLPVSQLKRLEVAAEQAAKKILQFADSLGNKKNPGQQLVNLMAQRTTASGQQLTTVNAAVKAAIDPSAMARLQKGADKAAEQAVHFGQMAQKGGSKWQDQADKAASRAALLSDALEKAKGASVPTAKAASVAGAAEGIGAVGGGLGAAALAGVGIVATAAVGLAAVLTDLVGKMKGYVEALNPTTVAAFDQAVRDLHATVGSAFQGVISILTGAVRRVASIIAPLADQLAPIFEEMANQFINNLLPIIKQAVEALQALMPVVRVLEGLLGMLDAVVRPVIVALRLVVQQIGFTFKILEVALSPLLAVFKVIEMAMDALSSVFDAVNAAFGAVIDTVVDLFKSLASSLLPFKSILDTFRTALKHVVTSIVVGIGRLLAAVDAAMGTSLKQKFIERLEGQPGKKAALQGINVKGIEQIAKDLAVASVQAAAGPNQKTTESLLQDAIDELKGIRRDLQDNKPKREGERPTDFHRAGNRVAVA